MSTAFAIACAALATDALICQHPVMFSASRVSPPVAGSLVDPDERTARMYAVNMMASTLVGSGLLVLASYVMVTLVSKLMYMVTTEVLKDDAFVTNSELWRIMMWSNEPILAGKELLSSNHQNLFHVAQMFVIAKCAAIISVLQALVGAAMLKRKIPRYQTRILSAACFVACGTFLWCSS